MPVTTPTIQKPQSQFHKPLLSYVGTPVTSGLTGDLCWCVCCYELAGYSFRIKAVDPEDC